MAIDGLWWWIMAIYCSCSVRIICKPPLHCVVCTIDGYNLWLPRRCWGCAREWLWALCISLTFESGFGRFGRSFKASKFEASCWLLLVEAATCTTYTTYNETYWVVLIIIHAVNNNMLGYGGCFAGWSACYSPWQEDAQDALDSLALRNSGKLLGLRFLVKSSGSLMSKQPM